MTDVIITMAGFGRRFLDAGYQIPKYRIEAHGRSLFAWSMLSLRNFIDDGARFIFVVRSADQAAAFIESEADALGIRDISVLEIGAPTDGQATTAMLAEERIASRTSPMLIYNIDTFVHPDALPSEAVRGDGWIPCFPAAGDHWSFARTDGTGRVVEVREKTRISDHATVGLYWFSSFDLYAQAYRTYYEEAGTAEAGERYVAPLYNHLLNEGAPVFIHEVGLDAVIPLGVPAEVERFLQSSPPPGL
jgi:dTDP-glucose pyrophosphorylase